MTVSSASTSRTLTLWWEHPEMLPASFEYSLYVDNSCVWTGEVTHCTLENLSPDTVYTWRLFMDQNQLADGAVRTRPAPVQISVRDFGAAGDGKTLDTLSLQKALDACPEGGEVVVPGGTYLTGALRLHSHMSLYLEENAVIQGTENPEDYLPKVLSRFEGTELMCYQSLLNLGETNHEGPANAWDVLIYGKGTIRGGGQNLCLNTIEREKELQRELLSSLGDKIKEYENDHTIPGRPRGRLIQLANCERVRITGLRLENGASWNVHMIYSSQIITDHCAFSSERVWNGDGWDPDSSENCTLFACTFSTGDDSVAIKSGKNPEGLSIARPTRHIRIFDCQSRSGLGIAIGSEMSGGVEDVRIWDCDLEKSLYGVQIKATKKRGGYVRSVHIRRCVLSRFLLCAVLYNDDGEGARTPPEFRDMVCEDVRFTGWAREYFEKEMHEVPCVDLSGFEQAEAENLSVLRCVVPENALIRLNHCRNVRVDVRETKVYEHDDFDPFLH